MTTLEKSEKILDRLNYALFKKFLNNEVTVLVFKKNEIAILLFNTRLNKKQRI